MNAEYNKILFYENKDYILILIIFYYTNKSIIVNIWKKCMNIKNIYLALISDSVIFHQNGNKLKCQFSIIYMLQKTYIYYEKSRREGRFIFKISVKVIEYFINLFKIDYLLLKLSELLAIVENKYFKYI